MQIIEQDKNEFRLSTVKYRLNFRFPAGTSRGVYTKRNVWYIIISSVNDPRKWGIGECAPLPGLSCDDSPDYEQKLSKICSRIERTGSPDIESLRPYPSILFGLETAFRQYNRGNFSLWDTSFSKGESGIPINGLIWMSDYRNMLSQIREKMEAGFRCIKLKIGAIAFDEELALLRHIRKNFTVKDIQIRVDANGAFQPADVMEKLNRLAELGIHSIEQPIRAGQWPEMAELALHTPLQVALDEELIGRNRPEEKRDLLETIRPQYIILKPSLHGGITGCNEWIAEAARLNIDWWITSALESNIGLNAIAQWCAAVVKDDKEVFQGLGTGGLFTNNIDMPLAIEKDCLWYFPEKDKSGPYHTYFNFLSEWSGLSPYIKVQTSGSTGVPKQMNLDKEKMVESARQTCSFLHLKAGDTALLCMPLQYIGAKMMVVRSLITEMKPVICEPSGHPLADVEEPLDFAAMTPLQVFNSLQVSKEKERLKQIKNLIIGGGAIDPEIEKELRSFPHAVYSTYGMTETVSHIALRRLNGENPSPYYTPFPSVSLSLSTANTLIIDAPALVDKPLQTNDIAELLPDGRFRITGRIDNIINSGGIKIQIETVEDKLRPVIPSPFAITSLPDPKFGEIVVLLITETIDDIHDRIAPLLSKYEMPKLTRRVKNIPITGNGKTDRMECKRIALNTELRQDN